MSDTTPKGTTKDFFVYLGAAMTLYLGVSALVALLFEYVDIYLPDALHGAASYHDYTQIRWLISVIVILGPVFMILNRIMEHDLGQDSGKLEIKARKRFIYSNLFIAAASLAGNSISLVYNFLNGELTNSFLVKSLILLVVSGSLFKYYFSELSRKLNSSQRRLVAVLSSVAIIAVVAVGFSITGTPGYQRKHRFDEQRIYAMRSLGLSISRYYEKESVLPKNLAVLKNNGLYLEHSEDPESGLPFEYNVKSSNSYELCGVFDTVGSERELGLYGAGEWDFHKGRNCFVKTVEKPKEGK